MQNQESTFTVVTNCIFDILKANALRKIIYSLKDVRNAFEIYRFTERYNTNVEANARNLELFFSISMFCDAAENTTSRYVMQVLSVLGKVYASGMSKR